MTLSDVVRRSGGDGNLCAFVAGQSSDIKRVASIGERAVGEFEFIRQSVPVKTVASDRVFRPGKRLLKDYFYDSGVDWAKSEDRRRRWSWRGQYCTIISLHISTNNKIFPNFRETEPQSIGLSG